ncbi:uncharacterized protein TRUGW13939_10214 [Talaromyces rugulosus]|uniref:Uncharacterized protein n=1 Tax=Talaromyces rugulosus TaxID=121627 RepID=A0A7H8R9R7_TALRU|nr:uncharacterized protein TRUGW13939_10214 [Talaromyces rugulosus]QKX63046.1 hypothetical protein TRUGW13939_10214 [Talaromyces rugulosus]
MLLTLKPPIQSGIKGPHEYSIVRQSLPTPHASSTTTATGSPPSTPPTQPSPERAMDQNPRRGLPPPAAMTLAPDAQMTTTATAPVPQLPPPPLHWHTPDDAMRHWLQTKAEEDRRRQEEERTRQESLRLEQRRIENNMLREAFQAGVPPHMVPLIFTGLGGGSTARSSWDMAQQIELSTHATHQRALSQHQHQAIPPPLTSSTPGPAAESAQTLPPDFRRDSRAIPPNPYATQVSLPPASAPSQPLPPSPTQSQRYSITSQTNSVRSSDLRPPASSVSRLNSGETRETPSSHAAAAQYQQSPSAPTPASMPAKSEAAQSSIFFHHWVPPGQSQPSTPSTKGQQETIPRSQLRSESLPSPPNRKRKAQGPHQPPPLPTSQPGQSPPRMVHASSRHDTPGRRGHGHRHSRGQSDVSYESRYREYSEPEQQRRRSDRGPGVDHSHSVSRRGYAEAETGPPPPHVDVEEGRPRSISASQYDPRATSQEGGYEAYHQHD